MTKFSKTELREQILRELAKIEPQIFGNAGLRAAEHLKHYFGQPVAIFKSLSNEIDTSLLIKSFHSVLLPGADPKAYGHEILRLGIKLVLVPGLGFDRQGHRLGRGGGYYDRCIAILRAAPSPPRIMGLCLEQQIIAEIPVEPHDQKVDGLCSQLRVIDFHHVYQP